MSGSVPPPGQTPPGSEGAPPGMPPGAGSAPGQPPIGSSPAQTPTPNRGFEAKGLAFVANAIKLLETAIPLLGSGSDPGKDALSALKMLGKHVQPGSTSQGVENAAMREHLQKQQQDAPMLQALRAQSGGAPPQPTAAGGQ